MSTHDDAINNTDLANIKTKKYIPKETTDTKAVKRIYPTLESGFKKLPPVRF